MRYHARKKFDKLNDLNAAIESKDANERQAAIKAKAKMNDSWHNRKLNVGDAWKRKNSKPGVVVVTKR